MGLGCEIVFYIKSTWCQETTKLSSDSCLVTSCMWLDRLLQKCSVISFVWVDHALITFLSPEASFIPEVKCLWFFFFFFWNNGVEWLQVLSKISYLTWFDLLIIIIYNTGLGFLDLPAGISSPWVLKTLAFVLFAKTTSKLRHLWGQGCNFGK